METEMGIKNKKNTIGNGNQKSLETKAETEQE